MDRGVEAHVRRRLDVWLDADPDPATRAELQRLIDDERWEELAARFDGRLTFGTAGLRAELGAGPLRMNRLVVRQGAAGLLHFLDTRSERAADGGRSRPLRLVVGHDARHRSEDFAADTAAVAADRGVEVVRFDRPIPTPVLAFAVRHLAADAGVMVTASHNPPADNGYKVYLADGAQLVPPFDERIARAIDTVAEHHGGRVRVDDPPPARSPDDVVDAYLRATVGALVAPGSRDVRLAYTPLSGVGLDVAERAFHRAGFKPLDVVSEQAEPDPDFAGLAFPNPEEPGVLDAVVALAERTDADLALANDPDADRLGVAVPDRGRWRALSGNEIGALLADHLLRHTTGDDRLVVTSVVSSRLVERLAEAAGVHFVATLTGFKWIVRPALEHPDWRFLFGYEEALGYSVSPVVLDKDGIAAALAFAELTAELRARGSSPAERLVELARAHGLHATRQWSIRFVDRHQGGARAAALMERVRQWPPASLAGQPVTGTRDLLAAGSGLPPSDAVLWDLDDGSRVVFRPSGTEPKLKVYLEVVRPVAAGEDGPAHARAEADDALATLQQELARLLDVPSAA